MIINSKTVKHMFNSVQKIYPITKQTLKNVKNHRRLITFYTHGCKCIYCDRIGTKIMRWFDNSNHLHIDIITNDGYLMTCEHVIPKSKGGRNHISNYLPACEECNNNRGVEPIFTNLTTKKCEYIKPNTT